MRRTVWGRHYHHFSLCWWREWDSEMPTNLSAVVYVISSHNSHENYLMLQPICFCLNVSTQKVFGRGQGTPCIGAKASDGIYLIGVSLYFFPHKFCYNWGHHSKNSRIPLRWRVCFLTWFSDMYNSKTKFPLQKWQASVSEKCLCCFEEPLSGQVNPRWCC